MSVLSYLNPKRAAAFEIAKDILRQPTNREAVVNRLRFLKAKDPGLCNLVIEELGKYGYRISVDS